MNISFSKQNGPQGRRLQPLSNYQAYLTPCLYLFILGIAWGQWMATDGAGAAAWTPLIHSGIAAILAGLVLLSRNPWVLRLSLFGLMFLLGVVYLQCRDLPDAADNVGRLGYRYGATADGVVEEERVRGEKKQVVVLLHQVNQVPASGRILVSVPKEMAIKANSIVGNTVEVTGDIRPPYSTDIPGAFNQAAYFKSQGISAQMTKVSAWTVTDSSPESPWYQLLATLQTVRLHIGETFARALPSPEHEIVGGVVLGSHAIPINRDLKAEFVQTGLVHILAASGMNVGIIAAAVIWLLGWGFRLAHRLPFLAFLKGRPLLQQNVTLGVAMACVLVYALLTGLPPSIMRAGGMIELALLLKLFDRQLTPMALLGLSATGILLWDPSIIANIGFQLSVLTTFGLVSLVPPLNRWLSHYVGEHFSGILLVPCVAQLWVFPMSVYYFNSFPLHSLLMNMLAVYLVTPMTVIGFAAAALSLVWQPLGEWISWLAHPLALGLLTLVHQANSWQWAQWAMATPPAWAVAGLYGTLMLWVILLYLPNRLTALQQGAVVMSGLTVVCLGLNRVNAIDAEQMRVDVLPFGRTGQALVVQWPQTGRVTLLLPTTVYYWQGESLLGFLRHHGLNQTVQDIILLPDGALLTGTTNTLRLVRQIEKGAGHPVRMLQYQQDAGEVAPLILDRMREGGWTAMFSPGQVLNRQATAIASTPAGLELFQGNVCLGLTVALSSNRSGQSHCPTHIRYYQNQPAILEVQGPTVSRYSLNHWMQLVMDPVQPHIKLFRADAQPFAAGAER